MYACFSKFVISLVVIVLLALAVAPGTAQDGPAQVGFRPDAPPYALHGPYWVGTREFVIEPDSERPLPLTVWYPALNPDGAEEAVTYAIDYSPVIPPETISGYALLDAVPNATEGPYPLVLFSHGAFGWRYSSLYFIEHLASQGFVVMSADHVGDTPANMMQGEAAFRRAHVTRPQDVTRVIDYAAALAEANGALPGLIDLDHVAVTGHSSGGWTALLAAGAQRDYAALNAWCAKHYDDMWSCGMLFGQEETLAGLLGLDAVPEGLWPSVGDPRVDAIVLFAPGNVPAFGAQGLASIKVPAMVLAGTSDQFNPVDVYALAYEELGSAQKAFVVFQDGGHTVFGDACKQAPWLIDSDLYWLCSDPVWDMDRVHDLTNHFTTAFLLATLKGDTEAATALAPEAVQFAGIGYEAQAFPQPVASACASARCCFGSQ